MERIKKQIKIILFPLFLSLFKSRVHSDKIILNNNSNILLIIVGNISHALQVTPLIEILHRTKSRISILTERKLAEAFSSSNFVSEIILLDEGVRNIIKINRIINSKSFNVIINTNESILYLVSIIVGLSKIKYKIGFKDLDANLYTHLTITSNKIKTHKVDRILSLLSHFEFSFNKQNLNICISISNNTEGQINKFLITNNYTNKFIVGINISSDDNNFWGVDNYKSLIKYFRNYDVNIVIFADPQDIEAAKLIAYKKQLTYFNTDLESFAALIKKTKFLISPKSYVIHLASAFNIPVFCLFHQSTQTEMLDIPYKSDFDFSLTENEKLDKLTFGNFLNNFVPFFENYYSEYEKKNPS